MVPATLKDVPFLQRRKRMVALDLFGRRTAGRWAMAGARAVLAVALILPLVLAFAPPAAMSNQ